MVEIRIRILISSLSPMPCGVRWTRAHTSARLGSAPARAGHRARRARAPCAKQCCRAQGAAAPKTRHRRGNVRMHGHRTRPGIFFLWNVIHSSMLLLRVLESRPENADANGRLTRRGSTATLSLPRACHRSRPGASADPAPPPSPPPPGHRPTHRLGRDNLRPRRNRRAQEAAQAPRRADRHAHRHRCA